MIGTSHGTDSETRNRQTIRKKDSRDIQVKRERQVGKQSKTDRQGTERLDEPIEECQ